MVWIDVAKCVSCGACGKVCGHQSIQDDNGHDTQRMRFLAWPKPEWYYEDCTLCMACEAACPANCIGVAKDGQDGLEVGFPYLSRPRMCLACGFCIEACATEAMAFRYPVLQD